MAKKVVIAEKINIACGGSLRMQQMTLRIYITFGLLAHASSFPLTFIQSD